MRWLALTLAILFARVHAGEQYPLWDGHESVGDYAKKVGLPPTKTLELGNGVKMELVLIPAGRFRQGVETPGEPPTAPSASINNAKYECFTGILILLIFSFAIVERFVRRRKGNFSLATFTVFILLCSFCVHGGASWYQAIQDSKRFNESLEAHNRLVMRYENATPDEYPARSVTIPTPFYLSTCEVTQGHYGQVLNGVRKGHGVILGGEYPASWHSYSDALEFCERFGKIANLKVRLPFESEWEFACRAGSVTQYCNGDPEASLEGVGWYKGNSGGYANPVATKTANKFGLFDMHGNVWEFCADALDSGKRVIRGGSFEAHPLGCRSSVRGFVDASVKRQDVGFRIVVSVDR